MTSSSPPPGWGISRQGTAASHRAPSRIQSWITGPAPPVPQQADQDSTSDNYSLYRLEWSDLKAWLERRFPGLVLPDRGKVKSDVWVFNIPKELDEDDRREIAVMRDRIHRRKQQAAAAAANGQAGQPANNPRRRVRSPERQRRH